MIFHSIFAQERYNESVDIYALGLIAANRKNTK